MQFAHLFYNISFRSTLGRRGTATSSAIVSAHSSNGKITHAAVCEYVWLRFVLLFFSLGSVRFIDVGQVMVIVSLNSECRCRRANIPLILPCSGLTCSLLIHSVIPTELNAFIGCVCMKWRVARCACNFYSCIGRMSTLFSS